MLVFSSVNIQKYWALRRGGKIRRPRSSLPRAPSHAKSPMLSKKQCFRPKGYIHYDMSTLDFLVSV